MKAQQDNGLTGNAWVKRVDEIRQMVNDQYNESISTPEQFVAYAVENYGVEFDAADIRIMRQEAEAVAERNAK